MTAAHCVTNGPTLANPISTTAYFYGGSDPDTIVPLNPISTAVSVSQYFINPLYTGDVIDEIDKVSTAGSDSAGPQFVTGFDLIGYVVWTYLWNDYGDVDDLVNSSFGEFNG